MKTLTLSVATLLGFCALGLTSAKAGPEYYHNHDYHWQRRVIVHEYYGRGYYENDWRPRYYYHRHNDFFLPVPLPPF